MILYHFDFSLELVYQDKRLEKKCFSFLKCYSTLKKEKCLFRKRIKIPFVPYPATFKFLYVFLISKSTYVKNNFTLYIGYLIKTLRSQNLTQFSIHCVTSNGTPNPRVNHILCRCATTVSGIKYSIRNPIKLNFYTAIMPRFKIFY